MKVNGRFVTVLGYLVEKCPDASRLSPIGSPVTKTGFETSMSLSGYYGALAVQALNSGGTVLATSSPVSG